MAGFQNETVVGTLGGTVLAILPHIQTQDSVRTFVLGIVGAVAGFITTQFCKWLWDRISKMFNRKKRQNEKERSN